MSIEYYQLLQFEAHSLLHNLQEIYLAKKPKYIILFLEAKIRLSENVKEQHNYKFLQNVRNN